MKKICVVTATRAEYGLLRRVINEIYQDKELELCLVVTGTHLMKKYGYTIEEIEKDGFPIAQKIEVSTQGNSEKEICYTMGEMTMKFADMYEQQKPDMLIVEGAFANMQYSNDVWNTDCPYFRWRSHRRCCR